MRLCGGFAGRGSLQADGRGYRQFPNDDPCPSGQRQQSPICHAVCGIARNSAQLLAPGASRIVPVSGARSRQAHRTDSIERRLPVSGCRDRPFQARHCTYVEAFLRHASSREWHGYPHHSSSARSRPSVEHGPLRAGFQQDHPLHDEPARSVVPGGDAAGLIIGCAQPSKSPTFFGGMGRRTGEQTPVNLAAANIASWARSKLAERRGSAATSMLATTVD